MCLPVGEGVIKTPYFFCLSFFLNPQWEANAPKLSHFGCHIEYLMSSFAYIISLHEKVSLGLKRPVFYPTGKSG